MRKYSFNDLCDIMKRLRADDGCPWDREQTHASLKKYMIEETYEVLDALDSQNPEKIADEMGDLLLQIVFHAQIGQEQGEYDIDDVTNAICEKMIRRHPHVFADATAETAEAVLDNWDKIKKAEKGQKTVAETLRDIPASFPALMRAQKVQAKAAKQGFDHETTEAALSKVFEEAEEVRECVACGKDASEEIGDLIFAATNVSRFLGENPEEALTKSVEKFIKRFEYIENKTTSSGKTLEDATLEEMDRLWNEAKEQGK